MSLPLTFDSRTEPDCPPPPADPADVWIASHGTYVLGEDWLWHRVADRSDVRTLTLRSFATWLRQTHGGETFANPADWVAGLAEEQADAIERGEA